MKGALVAAVTLAAAAGAWAQPAWPDKPITMIVPFPPAEPEGPMDAHGEHIYMLKAPGGLQVSFQSALAPG